MELSFFLLLFALTTLVWARTKTQRAPQLMRVKIDRGVDARG